MPSPRRDMGPVEVLWDGDGSPPARKHGTSGWKYYGMEIGYPLQPLCGQTDKFPSINITFPRTTYAGAYYCYALATLSGDLH